MTPSTLPLSNYHRFCSSDLDETRYNVAKVFSPHQLTVNDTTTAFATRVHEAKIGRSALVYITYGTAVSIETDCLNHCYLVQVPWEGSAEVSSQAANEVFLPGTASIISPRDPLTMRWSKDCSFYTVRLNRSTLEKKLAKLIGCELQEPLAFHSAFDLTTQQGRHWVNAVNFVRRQLEPANGQPVIDSVLEQFEDMLCLMLLQSHSHNYTAQLFGTPGKIIPKSIKRACDYIGDNLHQPISIDELATACGVAPATLTRHFKLYIGQSPMEYIREQKLEAVYQLLSRSTLDKSVTDIAMQYGFNHLGRFAEYYRKRYGELPSSTLKQLK